MSYFPSYKKGDWKVICDRCGFMFKGSQCSYEWTGLYVCDKCWDMRNPQDFLQAVRNEMQPVPAPRPEQPDQFVPGS